MNKYIPGILIGIGVGVASIFLLGMVFPGSSSPVIYGTFFGVFVAYILSNLAGNRKLATVSGPEKDQALQLTPPPGKSLLVVCREGFVAKLAGLNVAVDGKEFAQLTSPKFTCLVLPPGPHTLTTGFAGLAGPQSQKGAHDFVAPENGFYAVRIGARVGVIQGVMSFRPMGEAQAVRAKLASIPMVQAEPGEI
jgi:hypothetical protein